MTATELKSHNSVLGRKKKSLETDSIVLLVLISCKAEARGRYKLTNTARRTVIWTMNKNIQLKEPAVVAAFLLEH